MKCKQLASGVLISAVASWGAHAQTPGSGTVGAEDQTELDVIMSIVDENDTPDEVYQRIELPPATEVVTAPEIQLDEELNSITGETGELIENATSTVTDTLKEALSSGDIDELPENIKETIPDEVIEDLINDSTDGIGDAVDELEDSINNKMQNSAGDVDSAVEDIDESVRKTDEIMSELDDISDDTENISNEADSIDLDGAIDDVRGIDGL